MDSLAQDTLNLSHFSTQASTEVSPYTVVIYLMIVIGIIYFIAFLIKKTGLCSQITPNKSLTSFVSIFGSISVSQKEKVVVVKVQDSFHVLFVGEGTSQLLKEIPVGDVDISTDVNSENSFSKLFKTMINK